MRRNKVTLSFFLLLVFIASVAGRTMFWHTHFCADGLRIVHSHFFGDKHHAHTDIALDSIDVLMASPVDEAPETAHVAAPESGLCAVIADPAPADGSTAPHSVLTLRAPPFC